MATKRKSREIESPFVARHISLKELEKLTGYKSKLRITGTKDVLADAKVKKDNYNLLSAAEKRKEIAFDALYQMINGYYLMTSTYFNFVPSKLRTKLNKEFFDKEHKWLLTSFTELNNNNVLVEASNENCTVCARGALLVSKVRIGNDAKKYEDSQDIPKEFGREQFLLLEAFFEGNAVDLYETSKHLRSLWKNHGVVSEYLYFMIDNYYYSIYTEYKTKRTDVARGFYNTNKEVRFILAMLCILANDKGRFDPMELNVHEAPTKPHRFVKFVIELSKLRNGN